jgi:NAD(P)-dependent dehydrogenase (short-subunit alcohol dehydrogenase family)
MQTLALEGEKYDIRVNCLAPTAATQMTDGILSKEALAQLEPRLVSPGVVALVAQDAPTRAILCAGAGHFSRANITLTDGCYIGGRADAGERVIALWDRISDRTGEIVPTYGFRQSERELASAGCSAPAVAKER